MALWHLLVRISLGWLGLAGLLLLHAALEQVVSGPFLAVLACLKRLADITVAEGEPQLADLRHHRIYLALTYRLTHFTRWNSMIYLSMDYTKVKNEYNLVFS